MNERTKQLWEESQQWNGSDDGRGGLKILESVEKFAELIVQECIDIIAPYTVRMSRPGEEYLHPILEIRKHFGVEP